MRNHCNLVDSWKDFRLQQVSNPGPLDPYVFSKSTELPELLCVSEIQKMVHVRFIISTTQGTELDLTYLITDLNNVFGESQFRSEELDHQSRDHKIDLPLLRSCPLRMTSLNPSSFTHG